MKLITHPAYEVDIGGHVFVTAKYRLVLERLLAEGTVTDADLVVPEPATDAQVQRVHTREWVERIRSDRLSYTEQMRLEVPFSGALREASWLCAGGTLLTGRLALKDGIAVHVGGGFHHAFADHGEGFCLINDVAIAVAAMSAEDGVGRAVIIDLDVHHGNGTAAMFAGEPAVFTFSMHQQNNYPERKPAGDLDVGLADGTGDAEYMSLLRDHLPRVLETHRPDIGFYLAGADPYVHDQLGGLGLSLQGLRERDDFVLRMLRAAAVPVAVVLAGGYAERREDTVEIHCNTVRTAKHLVAHGHAADRLAE
jgi:acetoin utilization deacetylase AcuC-like enzyme